MEPAPQQSSAAIPIAIIVGFGMIALAIFFTGNSSQDSTQIIPNTENAQQAEQILSGPRPVDASDYIRGNPNAPILLVEYSDYDCPFCKQFHETMSQILDEYGVSGRLAWVYRQFPIAELHPNSPKISEAALCVGDIGGNDAFWTFTDLIFEKRDYDEPTNVTRLAQYAETAGIERADYIACMDSGRMEQAVRDSLRDALNAGAQGTPYTLVIAGNQQAVIDGAQSYNTVDSIVGGLLDQLDGSYLPEEEPKENIAE